MRLSRSSKQTVIITKNNSRKYLQNTKKYGRIQPTKNKEDMQWKENIVFIAIRVLLLKS